MLTSACCRGCKVKTVLTIDIGNSRIKWALWQQGQIVQAGEQAYDRHSPELAFKAWLDLDRPEAVSVACVAGKSIEQALNDWMQTNWSITPAYLATTCALNGVTNIYDDPEQYGVDRWAALLGAHEICQQPVCVIDAGTAITIDLMDAQGHHLGGRIMPGLAMMRAALSAGTAGIADSNGRIVEFASNTADAVSSGTLHMLHAALLEVCESAREQLGNDMQIIITGGTATEIMSLGNLPEMQYEPNLVLTGLHAAMSYQAKASS